LLPAGARLAGRKELETAVSIDSDFLKGNYFDFGLALRSAGDNFKPNDLLAKTLAEQLSKRGMTIAGGKLIPFSALKLKEDSNSAYGLVFDLQEDTKEIANLNDFKWDSTKDSGLACAYFNWYRYWCSNLDDVGNSYGHGRVVLVSAEGTSQNFEEYSNRIKREREELEARLDKMKRAEAILKGN
jgi:hypothetical protein